MRLPATCDTCGGRGAAPGTDPITCTDCQGAGEMRRVRQSLLGQVVTSVACSRCAGTGEMIPNPCPECRGEGRRLQETTLTVEVPAGVEDGSTLRLAEHGAAGAAGRTERFALRPPERGRRPAVRAPGRPPQHHLDPQPGAGRPGHRGGRRDARRRAPPDHRPGNPARPRRARPRPRGAPPARAGPGRSVRAPAGLDAHRPQPRTGRAAAPVRRVPRRGRLTPRRAGRRGRVLPSALRVRPWRRSGVPEPPTRPGIRPTRSARGISGAPPRRPPRSSWRIRRLRSSTTTMFITWGGCCASGLVRRWWPPTDEDAGPRPRGAATERSERSGPVHVEPRLRAVPDRGVRSGQRGSSRMGRPEADRAGHRPPGAVAQRAQRGALDGRTAAGGVGASPPRGPRRGGPEPAGVAARGG